MKALLFAAALAACQSAPETSPAVLVRGDAETLARVSGVLAEAVGRARVELGPGDLTRTSRVSVLPPPLGAHETHSLATPTQFDLVVRGGVCFARRVDTGVDYALEGVACRAAE